MSQFTIDKEQINIFELNGNYLFAHYFDDRELFSELEEWYNRDKYRFEVPEKDFNQVQETLEQHFFEPLLVEDPQQFCVTKDRTSENENILRDSIDYWTDTGKRVFIMKDKLSVQSAIEHGAEQPENVEIP